MIICFLKRSWKSVQIRLVLPQLKLGFTVYPRYVGIARVSLSIHSGTYRLQETCPEVSSLLFSATPPARSGGFRLSWSQHPRPKGAWSLWPGPARPRPAPRQVWQARAWLRGGPCPLRPRRARLPRPGYTPAPRTVGPVPAGFPAPCRAAGCPAVSWGSWSAAAAPCPDSCHSSSSAAGYWPR